MVRKYKGPLINRRGWWRRAHEVATGRRASFLDTPAEVERAARAGLPTEAGLATARSYGARVPEDATYGEAIDITTAAQHWRGRRQLRREGLLAPDAPASPRAAARNVGRKAKDPPVEPH